MLTHIKIYECNSSIHRQLLKPSVATSFNI